MRAISMPRTRRTVIDETTSPRASFSFTLLRTTSLGFTVLSPCLRCVPPSPLRGGVGGGGKPQTRRPYLHPTPNSLVSHPTPNPSPSRGGGPHLQLPECVELGDVAGWVDAGGDDGGAAGLHGGGERVAQALLRLDDRRVGAEGGAQLLPVDAAELDAVQRDALDLLLDADQADLLVVEHHDDDGKLLEPRRLQLGHRHQEATVAAEGHDGAIGMREPRTQRARDGIAHGS